MEKEMEKEMGTGYFSEGTTVPRIMTEK